MHIKQVIIEGFKSYKNQTIADPFSNRINTVVGANGSGKSNFFHAIRFVLDNASSNTRLEERQKLLHEGAGHAVLSAYVEIVFDNSDNRFPVDREEVRLRRTVGLKKDEYQLDRKKISKSEVINLLESAGFSRANPYYVVQQGKIMAMSTMRDEQRLDLLKEIGGSKVYEERRKESLKIMYDADSRKSQVAELVADMEAKLAQLDQEKEELDKYQKIDKERRSLEYTIYDMEFAETRAKLEQIEEQRGREAEKAGQALQARQAASVNLKEVKKELKGLAAQAKEAEAACQAATQRKQDAMDRDVQLKLDVQDLERRQVADEATQATCKQDLKQLAKEIARTEKELKAAEAEVSRRRQRSNAITAELDDAKRRLRVLEEKSGQQISFATVDERDAWIRQTVEAKNATKKGYSKQMEYLATQIEDLSQELAAVAQERSQKEAEIKQLEQSSAAVAGNLKDAAAKKNEANEAKREHWRRAEELRASSNGLKREVADLERTLDGMSYNTSKALRAVRNLSKQHHIPIHGIVLDLVDAMPQLYTAIEVAAAGSMYHMVVDTDDQVTRLVELMKKEKGGRLTYLPLNRMNPEHVQYPHKQQFGKDAVPLINYLEYNEQYKRIICHVFGKWLVCKDLEVASRVFSEVHHLNCVTIDGDVYNKRGTLTGGHRDESRSKLAMRREIQRLTNELDAATEELRELDRASSAQEAIITEQMNVEQRLRIEDKHMMGKLQHSREALKGLQRRWEEVQHSREAKQRSLAEKKQLSERLDNDIEDISRDLGSPELGRLAPEEQQERQRLQPQITHLQEECTDCQQALEEAQAKLLEVESLLTDDLRRRQQELQDQLTAADVAADEETLAASKREAAAAEAELAEASQEAAAAQAKVEELAQRIQEKRAEADQFREVEQTDQQTEQDEARAVEQLLAKRSVLEDKKESLEKKIRELGSLPQDAFEKFRGSSLKELTNLLNKAQAKLKKYGHVNKKALDQYKNFTEQREELARRQAETVAGNDKIKELIRTLDMRKDDAIERTFKGVAKNFREIFAELAPGGRGELVMVKSQSRAEPQEDKEGEDGEEPNESAPHEKYSGVKVKVSFGSGETMSLKQLSGGQKTLVALALIFAIQRLDPAPFYLFDEIDAALDSAYRTTVARMLARQASDSRTPSQFIITTFHPQIIHETDNVYGVSHSNRISDIRLVSKDDALQFIQAKAQEPANGHWMREN